MAATADGCSDATGVWDVRPVNGHELTHVLLEEVTGGRRGHLPINEGLATALSCQPFHSAEDTMFLPHWAEWDSGQVDIGQYEVAGKLVTAMAFLKGLPAVIELYRSVPQGSSIAQLDTAVAAAFGQGLDKLWNTAVTKGWPYCIPVYGCARGELNTGTTHLSVGCSGYEAAKLPQRSGDVIRLHSDLELDFHRCEFKAAEPPELRGTTGPPTSSSKSKPSSFLAQKAWFVAPLANAFHGLENSKVGQLS